MRLISFTYRHCKGGLILPGTLANNREAGTGYLDTHIPPGTLGPCLENINSLDNKGRNHESNVKEQPPLGTKTQGRDTALLKGRPQKQLVPTGITEGEIT